MRKLKLISRQETSQLISDIDWREHSLSPIEFWPEILINTLNIILNTQNPVFIFWGEKNYCFYNDGYIPILGYGKHPSVLGKPAQEVWPEIWDAYTYPELKKALDGDSTWNVDQHIPVFRNGKTSEAYFTYGYSPIYLNDGSIGGVIVIANETTEKIVAQKNLKDFLFERESELETKRQSLYSVLMQAPVGICVLEGPEHVFTLANEGYFDLIGGKRDILEKPIREALPEIVGQGFYEILDEVYKTGIPFIGKEAPVSLVQKDGSQKNIFVNFTYQPKYNLSGKIDGIIAVAVDVTSQISARMKIEDLARELREALKIKDEFLSIASHELRTPMTSLKLQLQMLRKAVDSEKNIVPPAEKLTRTLDLSNRQVDRLTLLIDDLLDVTRIGSGKMQYTFQEENLSSIVNEVLEKLEGLITENKYSIILNLQNDVLVKCDRFRIEQVIINLLTNAMKYGAYKPISISVYKKGSKAFLSFEDQGVGIALEMQTKIFQRFERAATEKNISGLGLGLYICKQIIDAHEGSIGLVSTYGSGTVFTVELPIMS